MKTPLSLFLFALLALGSACKQAQPTIEAITISVMDPFPPKAKQKKHTISLSPAEVGKLRGLLPPLSGHDKVECACGVPQMSLTFKLSNGQSVQGHFFHGKNRLRLFPSKGKGGSLKVQDGVYKTLYALVARRGHKLHRKP